MSSNEKEEPMTLKAQVSDRVSDVVVDRLDDAKDTLTDWGAGARRVVRKNPALAIAGAFAVGFVVAKLARRHD